MMMMNKYNMPYSCGWKIYFIPFHLFQFSALLNNSSESDIFPFFLAALRTYKLPMSNIIPFPKRNDPPAQDFPPGRQVLAVYPRTTALYKATVVNSNRKVMFSSLFGLL